MNTALVVLALTLQLPGVAPPMPDCRVTEPAIADPGVERLGEIRLPPDRWYVNSDKTIWAGGAALRLLSDDTRNGIVWIRPKGQSLTVTARRLDGGSTRTSTLPPGDSPFVVSALLIRDAGCWEVTATAGENELRFVTVVQPPEPPPQGEAR